MTRPTLLWGRRGDPHLEVIAEEFARRSKPTVRLESDHPKDWKLDDVSGLCAFARRETWGGTSASSLSRPEALWFAHPAEMYACEDLLSQLERARELGLKTPRTSAIADKESTGCWVSKRRFRSDCPGSGANTAWVSEATSPQRGIVYQEFIDKSWEIRANVIDDQAVAVLYRPVANREFLDWSLLEPEALELMTIRLPSQMRRQACALVLSYGLRFGAIDFVLPRGASSISEAVFLELNPFAAWQWLDHLHSPTITELIVDAVLGGDGGCLGARSRTPRTKFAANESRWL